MVIPILAAAGAAVAKTAATVGQAAVATAKAGAEAGAIAGKAGGQVAATTAQATGKTAATLGEGAANTAQTTLAPEPMRGGKFSSLQPDILDVKTGKVMPDDVLKMAETSSIRPSVEKTGGTYGELKKEWSGKLEAQPPHEIHHMPANEVNGLQERDGPAIVMEKADHRQTASCGSSLDAHAYRQQQKMLINDGKFQEAMQMDIDDIHDKFGNKYDDAIAQMKETAKEKGLI